MANKDPEPFENSKLFRLNNWVNFIKSDEWKEFKGLLLQRKTFLEGQVLICVRAKKFDDAMLYEARADELCAIVRKAESHTAKIEEEDDAGR